MWFCRAFVGFYDVDLSRFVVGFLVAFWEEGRKMHTEKKEEQQKEHPYQHNKS